MRALLLLVTSCWFATGLLAQVEPFAVSSPHPVAAFTVVEPVVSPPEVTTGDVPEGCTGGGFVVPLLATDFAAERLDPDWVRLRWRVAYTETPMSWVLERRLDLETAFTPQHRFSEAELLNRELEDKNPYPGRSYYRLAGTAADGARTLTAVRHVDNPQAGQALRLFPNPAPNELQLFPPLPTPATLTVVDGRGRIVLRKSLVGTTAHRLDVTILPPGVYLLRWQPEQGRGATARLVKQ